MAMSTIAVREYIVASGKSAYVRWFERLDAVAAARVATAVYRLSVGNFSNTKGVGAGVKHESTLVRDIAFILARMAIRS